ncbi:DUF4419 domain-containing protein [Candidatus Uhrbacteria bacterium]|nr:DUF4419 domain-containing protein [Candidatus Uhrbacteria bacterium]
MSYVQIRGNGGRELPSVWQGEKVPVCRELVLQIPEIEDQRPTGRMIQEEAFSKQTTLVQDYIHALVPDGIIEHMGRREMLALPLNTSSLFLQAVHACFANHYPLALRPEVLMQVVLTQIAEVVKRNPEHYRDLFTTSAKQETIRVRHDGLLLGNSNSPWHEAIRMFHPELQKRVPSHIMGDMLAPFTTDTIEAQLARLISFMDAASKYYKYVVETRCGIPRVRMLGTRDDWVTLAQAVNNLSRFFGDKLGKYFQELIPVTQKLASQASGETTDDRFWTSLYKCEGKSGTPQCNGWITALFNYVQNPYPRGNALVEKYSDEIYGRDYENQREKSWEFSSIAHNSVPSLISQTPFIWDYHGTEIPMMFMGGVLGIDDVGGCLTPSLSYAVIRLPATN